MQEFFTREVANEGIELPLWLPDGTKSEHWIKIRGIDSDVFRAAEARTIRSMSRLAALSEEEQSGQAEALQLDLLCALVMDWSFDQECSADNVRTFLKEAPQIADAINKTAGKRALFFRKKSES